jgi:hypothetical protein
MKYLCLVYLDEKKWDAQSSSEYDALVREILDYREDLRTSGHLVLADALHHDQQATTVRIRNGKVSVTDGPFAETKEQLGGFYLIDADDLNEAIRLAAKIPSARLGSVEVRPIKELAPR